ncbi:MAG: DUF1156 domain-containing protein [Verrucomicrobiota bacterium]
MTYKKKLIEVALPLEDINREAAREKSIRHGHPLPRRKLFPDGFHRVGHFWRSADAVSFHKRFDDLWIF